MATSLSRSFPLFFLSLALVCFFTFANLIDDVCTRTRNPSLCSNALRADSRSRGADLKLLGQISIDLATKSAKSCATLVTNLKNSATDPRVKGIYDSCLANYDDGLAHLGESNEELKNGDYLGMNMKATAAQAYIGTCDENFQDPGAPAEPTELKAANQNAQDLCSSILVISNRLRD